MKSFRKNIDYVFDGCKNLKFDYLQGVHTRGEVSPEKLITTHEHILHARKYQGTPISVLSKIFSQLPIDPTEFHFLDIGCGKGRVLQFANFLPFLSFHGVELCKDLSEIARDNLDFCEVFNGDICDYTPVNSKHVFFMFNPFDEIVLKKMINHFEDMGVFENHCLFIYVNPLRSRLFDSTKFQWRKKIHHKNHNKSFEFLSNRSFNKNSNF